MSLSLIHILLVKPRIVAPTKVKKMPSWAAAPSSRLDGRAISGSKSVSYTHLDVYKRQTVTRRTWRNSRPQS